MSKVIPFKSHPNAKLSSARRDPAAWDDVVDALSSLRALTDALLVRCERQATEIEDLSKACMTDPHTNILNRRALVPMLKQAMSQALSQHQPLALAFVDLDHFKMVNDRHGHDVGDQLLKAVVKRLHAHVRDSDVLLRRSGEEFVLILPGTGLGHAARVCERISESLQHAFELGSHILINQTASFGVAQWDKKESPEQLEKRADEAMYQAKLRGRNRVCVSLHPAQSEAHVTEVSHTSLPSYEHLQSVIFEAPLDTRASNTREDCMYVERVKRVRGGSAELHV